jgi:hypothetical protein
MTQQLAETLAYRCAVVVARNIDSSHETCKVLIELGIERVVLVTKYHSPMELIKRADAEGGVPIVLIWQEPHDKFVQTASSVLDSNTLPGRPIFLMAPHEEAEAFLVADMGEVIREYRAEILNQVELGKPGVVRELLRRHLLKAPASYLGIKQQDRNATPAPVTTPPNEGERNVNNIERRIMQRGMFHVKPLRTPRF